MIDLRLQHFAGRLDRRRLADAVDFHGLVGVLIQTDREGERRGPGA